MPLDETHRQLLHEIARHSIRYGLTHHGAPRIEVKTLPPPLQIPSASFVTLEINGRLRGCIGTLDPYRPMAEDVNANAYSAAFSDPRFPPLEAEEEPHLDVRISILQPATPIICRSEAELLQQLQPGVDGLILCHEGHRATFLPSVWSDLRHPREFVRHLKQKAGLPANYWNDRLQFFRYETEAF